MLKKVNEITTLREVEKKLNREKRYVVTIREAYGFDKTLAKKHIVYSWDEDDVSWWRNARTFEELKWSDLLEVDADMEIFKKLEGTGKVLVEDISIYDDYKEYEADGWWWL